MSDGDDEPEDADALAERLAAAESELADAETEADLDEVEATLDAIETDIEEADLPEPDEDDEDADDPREELEDDLSTLRDDLEEARGPYAEDVIEEVEGIESEIEGTRWTEDGLPDVRAAIEAFLDAVDDVLGADIDDTLSEDDEIEALTAALDRAIEAVDQGELDPDDDAETIAELLSVTDDLANAVDDAEEWDDLTVREQLQVEGFYDVLGHYKDFPPEWSALKEWEKRGRADMIVLGFETFDSGFMEDHCKDALARMGSEEALEPMLQLAQRRDQDAIRVLGKVGSEEAVDQLLDYIDPDGDAALQRVTATALGEIGSEEAVEPIAQLLAADHDDVRSNAARALGLIGDPRAIEPLADLVEEDDEDTVRASAAWALNQIGTEDALAALDGYEDDRAYLVQAEAEKAAAAIGA